jgi:RND family efflux transporter MFP subunit
MALAGTCPAEAASVSVTGITEAFLDVTLGASVPGIISVQKHREGDFVKEGEVIVELDKRLEELETARRKLVVDVKWSDYDGTQKLFKSTKGVSKEELEKKQMEYNVAVVEHEMAAEQLRRRLIPSPLSGTITEIFLDVGEACQPYQPVARVVDARRCYLVANLDPGLGARLKTEQTVKLEIETGAAPVAVEGKITYLGPVVDPASGLLKVKVLFDNPGNKIRPGAAGRILLE